MALSTTQYGYIIDPMVPFTDGKGKTIKDGFVRVFVAGSSTPVITYRNFDGAANQDLIELDNSGRTKTSVIGSKGITYKVCVYDQLHSQESPILTVDKVSVIGANITAGAGATVVTGLDGFRTKPDGFVDASVVGTDGYVALDHTLVTDDLNTDAKVTAVENDRYVPLLNNDVNDPDSKITLGRLWQWVLGKIKSLSTTITAFRTGDVIPVDGPSGTAKMTKDDLLKATAENALGSIHSLSHVETDGFLAVDNATNGAGKMNTSVIFNNFAVKFVANSTEVFKGNLYIHEGVLYKAKENYKGAWDSSKFVQASASNYFQLEGDLTHKQVTSGNANTIHRDISAFNFEEGKYYKVNIKLRNFSQSTFTLPTTAMCGIYTLTDSSDYASKVDTIYQEMPATILDKEVAIIFKASGDANYLYFYLSSGTANSVVLFDMTDGASIQVLGEMNDELAGVVKKVSVGIEDPDVFSKVLTLEKTTDVGINRAMNFYKFRAGKSYRVKIDLSNFVEGSLGEDMVMLRTISDPRDFTSVVDVVYSLVQTTVSEKHLEFIFTSTGDANYIYLYIKSSTAGASASVDVYDSKIEGTTEKADTNPFSEILSGEYPSKALDFSRYIEVCNFKKGHYYKVVLEVDDLHPADSRTSVVLGLYTLTDKFDYTSKVDYIYEILYRSALDEKKEIVFKATDDAPYLYIYQCTNNTISSVKISVQNAPCQEGEVKELNQSVFGVHYSKIVTNNAVDSVYRRIEPYDFKKDKIYSIKLRLENFSKNSQAAVGVDMFGLYTLTDSSDYASKVDIIYAEPQATISEKEVEFTFKASGNANYIYFYLSSGTTNATATLEMKSGGVIKEIEEIKENIGSLNIPVSDGKKYTGPRLDLFDYKFSKKKVATLSLSNVSYTSRQGNACFGNLFYQLYHGGFCDVYDIENGYANVGSFLLGSADASNHANEAVFIRGRHYNGNEIPLLLVTIGNSAKVMKASVENIVESSGTFTATQLQELTLDQSGFAAAGLVPYWGWPAWFAENDRLYVFGAKIRTTTQYADQYDENRYICTEFRMPDVSEGNVTLTADDVIAQHLYKFNVFTTQGGTIFNNKIIYTFGFGEQSSPDIIQVYDVNTDEILNRIDLSDISQEIESCSVHDGKLLVGFNSGDLWELKF